MKQEENIKVVVRVRPNLDGGCEKYLTVDDNEPVISVPGKPDAKRFTYDSVGDGDSTQEQMFATVGKKTVEAFLSGYNATIFAYGQTGSGKTFTMMGPGSDDSIECLHSPLRGIIPRALESLFVKIEEEKSENPNKKFLIKCSFVEIYNELVYDLLNPSSQALALRESIKNGVFVDGLSELPCSSPIEAYEILINGMVNRHVGSTSMNRESSRSHAVFTIHLESKEKRDGLENLKCSHLHLVDLAGSERQKDTKADGLRLKEAGNINKSLAVLGSVIMALVDVSNGKSRFVRYRDSKLTFLLRDSLGGNSKTYLIACVHPGIKYIGESIATLQFASRAKLIKNKARVNEDVHGNVRKLQEEIRALKEQIVNLMGGQHRQVETEAANVPASSVVDITVWRSRFLGAMALRQMSMGELLSVRRLLEASQETSDRLEKVVQSKVMVIKFRDSAIQRLEKRIKQIQNPNAPTEAEEDSTIADLQHELSVTQKQLRIHPYSTSAAGGHFQAELDRLKRDVELMQPDREKMATELEEKFHSLLADGEVDKAQQILMNSCSHQEEISKLQSEKEEAHSSVLQVRQQLAEAQSLHEKEQRRLEAELKTFQKSLQESERLRMSALLRMNLERRSMVDRHIRTIQSLTPKSKRTEASHMDSPLAYCNSPLTPTIEEDDGILWESPPEESTINVLTDDLKQQEDTNAKLLREIDTGETEILSLKEKLTKVEYERSQQKTDLKIMTETVKRKVECEEQMKNDLNSYIIKAEDFEVRLKVCEKELQNTKEEKKRSDDRMEKDKALFVEKTYSLESKLFTAQKELDVCLRERDTVQQELDTARDAVSFMEAQLQKQEALVQELEATGRKRSAEIQQLTERLTTWKSCADEQGKERNRLLEELEQRMQEVVAIETAVEEGRREREDLRSVRQELVTEKEQLTKAMEEAKKVTKSLQNQLTTATEKCSNLTNEMESTEKELRNACELNSELNTRVQEMVEQHAMDLKSLQTKLEQEKTDSLNMISALTNDLNHLQIYSGDLEEEVRRIKKNYEEEMASVQRLYVEATSELESVKMAHENCTAAHSEASARRRSSVDPQNLRSKLIAKDRELMNQTEQISSVIETNKRLEELIQEKNDTINRQMTTRDRDCLNQQLIEALDENTLMMESSKKLTERVNTLNDEVNLQKEQISRISSERQDENESFQRHLNNTRNISVNVKKDNDRLKEEIQVLLDEREELFQGIPQAGHLNPKQKIHYLEKVREDLSRARNENIQLRLENNHLKQVYADKSLEKENVPPAPSLD